MFIEQRSLEQRSLEQMFIEQRSSDQKFFPQTKSGDKLNGQYFILNTLFPFLSRGALENDSGFCTFTVRLKLELIL
jgi:hypothetical protein